MGVRAVMELGVSIFRIEVTIYIGLLTMTQLGVVRYVYSAI